MTALYFRNLKKNNHFYINIKQKIRKLFTINFCNFAYLHINYTETLIKQSYYIYYLGYVT